MFLLGGVPSFAHSTFARFRSIHFAPCSKHILAEKSTVLFDLGEISAETIFIDGTKNRSQHHLSTVVQPLPKIQLYAIGST